MIAVWVLALVSVVGLLLWNNGRRRRKRLATYGMTVEGTVIDNKRLDDQRFCPVVRYRVGDEKFTRVARRPLPVRCHVGDKMPVRYDPNRPSDAEVLVEPGIVRPRR